MNWFNELKAKLDTHFKDKEIWFDYDSGQLNPNQNGVFSVSFPCALLRLDRVSNFETIGNSGLMGIASVSIRFATKLLEKTHNYAESGVVNVFPNEIEAFVLAILEDESLQGERYEIVKIESINRENRSDLQIFAATIATRCAFSTQKV